MDVVYKRVDDALLKCVTDTYIDYRKPDIAGQFFYAQVDKSKFENWNDVQRKLNTRLVNNEPVNLVIEARLEKDSIVKTKKRIDYLVKVEFP